ncbi:MAG TPA: methionyl-tRNA formyltransferase [Candidatus Paceibacterota bacterium]
MKNIAFFGTPDFTTDFLDILTAHGYTPSLIVTNPDSRVGRGMALTSPAPKVWAQEHNIAVIQPERIDDAVLTELAQTPWDLFVVIAYGKILPETLITLPKHGTINVHYSLLPKYRGATPVESAILNGEDTTGVCIQHMRYKLDSGPIIATEEVAIEPHDTTLTLRARLNDSALELLPKTIEAIFSGTAAMTEQDESKATHCGKISKADGEIKLSDGPLFNDRKFRAHVGNVGTYFYTEKNGKPIRVKVTKAHLYENNFVIDEVIPENGKPQAYDSFIKN